MRPRRWDADRRVQAEQLGATIVHLRDVALSEAVSQVVKVTEDAGRRQERFDDLARLSYVMDLIDGGSLLDVGVARGVFLNGCALSGRFDRLVGIDIDDYQPLRLGGWDMQFRDVCDLTFPDASFDTVTAMEIVEHLPDSKVHGGIAQIRRVATRRLLTVPFCEQPLGKHHRQAFDAERLAALFPNARFTVLVKQHRGTPWVLIEERQ